MALVLQIVLAILLLVGLVAVFLSAKNWHWSQFVLLLFIMLTSVGFMILAAETIRIHRAVRGKLPRMQQELADLQRRNNTLEHSAGEVPGIKQLQHRLRMATRERGRAWRQVTPTGGLNNQGQIEVAIPAPSPHGLAADAVVFAFEMGEANPASPVEGKQYLGQFLVVDVREGGVLLAPMTLLDQRTGERLARSQGPWSLYESMPADRHSTFAGMSEEELRARLPASIVENYLRHGQEATSDDDPRYVIGFDENDQRLGPDDMDQAVRKRYNRPLVDYDYLFSELAREKVVLLAKRDALVEDNKLLADTLASAEKLSEFRQQEIQLFEEDLAGMQRDRQAIEAHLTTIQRQLKNARDLIGQYLAANTALARDLAARESALQRAINATAPAPASLALP